MPAETEAAGIKGVLRREALAARARTPPAVASQTDADLAAAMGSLPVDLPAGATVAAYVATDAEPGGIAMLDALVDRGFTVILPLVPAGGPAPLDWAEYRGRTELVVRRWGLLEPTGRALGGAAIERADLVLVPALGADRSGGRLGRGAGYYDRTLDTADAPVVAVVNDAEFIDSGIPQDAHDVPVAWVLTPGGGFVAVGG